MFAAAFETYPHCTPSCSRRCSGKKSFFVVKNHSTAEFLTEFNVFFTCNCFIAETCYNFDSFVCLLTIRCKCYYFCPKCLEIHIISSFWIIWILGIVRITNLRISKFKMAYLIWRITCNNFDCSAFQFLIFKIFVFFCLLM